MKKILRTLTPLLFILFLLACSKTTEYTISFETNTDQKIEAIKVKKGEKLSLPEDPENEGYIFEGWFIGEDKFNTEEKITKDLTLVAHWKVDTGEEKIEEVKIPEGKKSYTVTFVYYSGVKNVTKTVEENKTVSEPKTPTRSGYIFNGWYLGEQKYDFKSKITKNITLTSKWTKIIVIEDNSNNINIPEINVIEVESIKVNSKNIMLTKGQTYKIVTTFTPANATNKKLTYTSAASSIASVNENGVITANASKDSTTKITVKSSNGKAEVITVRAINPVTSVALSSTGYNGDAISQFGTVTKKVYNFQVKAGVDYKDLVWSVVGSGGFTLGSDCQSGSTKCTVNAKPDGNQAARSVIVTATIKNTLGEKVSASKTVEIEGKFKVAPMGGIFGSDTYLLLKGVTLTITPGETVKEFKVTSSNSNLIIQQESVNRVTVKCKSTAPLGETFTLNFVSTAGQTDKVKIMCIGN